ncbi:MAG TPA: DMT family protein [Phycisphaerales bacterium]|nr:DMT family protein [Phycisphaerales bacterium]
MNRALASIGLLVLSNVFMTTAWYWHLKHKAWPMLMAIGISWLIALPEYCLQVPANRLGHITMKDGVNVGGPFTAPQLKVIQEAITLIVFTVFTVMILKEKPRWNDMVAFGLVMAAVAVSVLGNGKAS